MRPSNSENYKYDSSNTIVSKHIASFWDDISNSNSNNQLFVGGNNLKIHELYLLVVEKEISELIINPNFNSKECIVNNVYFSTNYYNNLLNFIKNVIINMLNPNANDIYSEKDIMKKFNEVFLSMLPEFVKIIL